MAGEGNIRLFISCVSDEFRDYRDQLRHDLTRHNVEVKVQEDFINFGTATLDMLDRYIANCHAVIHLVGDMTGALADAESVRAIRARFADLGERLPALGTALAADVPISYTQWEAWLALYHGKRLLIAHADEQAPRGRQLAATEEAKALQVAHLARLRDSHRYPGATFRSPDELAKQILRTAIVDLLAEAGAPARKPNTLPHAPLGSLFKGREPLMAELSHVLGEPGSTGAAAASCVALHGLGGVGKTRLAIEYGHRHADAFTAMLFVSAETPQQLEADFARLVGPPVLDLPEQEAREDAVKVAAALAWLGANPGWLLILDNVDSEPAAAAAEALLARLSGGQILITGRMANFGAGVETLELDVLGIEDAAVFLLERTRGKRAAASDDAEWATAIAAELGLLALALEQAGAYIARHRIGLARYAALWREAREKVLGWFDPRLMRYPRSVAVTWATSVAQLSPESWRLLDRLAWLAPEPIPERILDIEIPAQEEAGGIAMLAFDPREALVGLFDHSLAVPSAADAGSTRAADDGASFVVHRLVQEVTRRNQAGSESAALAESLQWMDAAFTGDPWDRRTWPRLEPVSAHVRAAIGFADQESAGTTAIGHLARKLARFYSARGKHRDAEPLFRRALASSEQNHGPNHPDVATSLNDLASLLRHLDRTGEAEPAYRRALSILEATHGLDHPHVATSLNGLAGLLCDTNRPADAEPLYRRALAIREASYGPDHPLVATSLVNIGSLLRHANRGCEAEPLFRRALAIRVASYGPDNPHVAGCLNELAWLLQDDNRVDEAEPLVRQALAIFEASYGPDHPHVAVSLNSLAQVLQDTDRRAEAEPLLRRALVIRESSYGPDHPYVAISLNNLAFLIGFGDRAGEAEELSRRALAILEASYGPDHPQVATSLNNLAGLLSETGRHGEAELTYWRALAIYEASLGPGHPLVARNLDNLAWLLAEVGRTSEAEELLRRAASIGLSSLADGHPWTERIFVRLRLLLGKSGCSAEEITKSIAAIERAAPPLRSGVTAVTP